MIEDCEKKIAAHLVKHIEAQHGGVMPSLNKKKRKAHYKKGMKADVTTLLNEVNKIDVTEIIGISELSVLSILSETGTDMSRWKDEKYFTSWLGLAPNTKISGGKVISSSVPRLQKKKLA
jgi:transposase